MFSYKYRRRRSGQDRLVKLPGLSIRREPSTPAVCCVVSLFFQRAREPRERANDSEKGEREMKDAPSLLIARIPENSESHAPSVCFFLFVRARLKNRNTPRSLTSAPSRFSLLLRVFSSSSTSFLSFFYLDAHCFPISHSFHAITFEVLLSGYRRRRYVAKRERERETCFSSSPGKRRTATKECL